MKRKLPSNEKLTELFKEYNDVEIARMYNVSSEAVCKRRNRLGIESIAGRNKHKLPLAQEFIELYKTHSQEEIATMYDCSVNSVATMAKRLGLRKNGQLPTGDEFKKLYFKHPRKELANMYGVDVTAVDYRAKQLGIYNDDRRPKLQGGIPSKCPEKETLLNLLEQYSIEEIAIMYNMTTTTVYRWFLAYKIRRTKLIAASKEEFIELYKHHTYAEIAEICGLSEDGVYWRVRKYGLTRKQYPLDRSSSEKIKQPWLSKK